MTSHDHDAVVRLGGRVQPVDGVVAICTAVSKPNVSSVADRSLSIVFGTPTTRHPSP